MFFLTPKYLKRAKLLHKAVTRFLNYKRDLLPQAKLDEINGLRTELEKTVKARDEKRLESLADEINRSCDRALPQARTSWLAENTEVFFVSIVIALGIRAYIAQPFQIPTGSMQPTLSGITAETTADDPNPGLFGKFLGIFTGTKYINAISDHDGYLDMQHEPVTEHQVRFWRTYCTLHFTDGYEIEIDAPIRQLFDELQLATNLRAGTKSDDEDTPDMRARTSLQYGERIHIRVGQVLARGILRNGDHVIVNKFAYHFRRPARGEVFVFTTKNIDGIHIPAEQGSQHYIKRLGGVPGDKLDVRSPELYINDKLAEAPGFKRVMSGTKKHPVDGYQGYSPDRRISLPITLATEPRREYFALGDNSYNSSDSRYWGTVPEQNVVGPGWFCYWPLTKHFGPTR